MGSYLCVPVAMAASSYIKAYGLCAGITAKGDQNCRQALLIHRQTPRVYLCGGQSLLVYNTTGHRQDSYLERYYSKITLSTGKLHMLCYPCRVAWRRETHYVIYIATVNVPRLVND